MNLSKTRIIMVLAGFMLLMAGLLVTSQNINFGGLILIGPIPIAIGSSPEMTVIAMGMGLVILIVYLIVNFLLWRHNEKEEFERATAESRHYEESTAGKPEKKIKGGGVIIIGPVPIVFGSDWRYVVLVMLIAIALMVVWILLIKS